MKPVAAELHAALSAWLADATSASPSEDCRSYGLCSYVRWNYANVAGEALGLKLMACYGRKRAAYPFGYHAFNGDCINETQHLNRKRLAWVRRVLKAGIA